jgi:hypothetical protein
MTERFGRIPPAAAGISLSGDRAWRVYIAIAGHADKTGRAFPALSRIATLTGIDRKRLPTIIDELELAGLIRREGVGPARNTIYRIVANPDQRALNLPPVMSPHTGTSDVPSHGDIGRHGMSPHTDRDVPLQGDQVVPVQGDLTDQGTKKENRRVLTHSESEVDSAFEKFWQAYPHRGLHADPKKPAAEKFVAAVKRGAHPAIIIAAAERYRRAVEKTNTAPRFVAQAVTWLNQARWDEQEPEPMRRRPVAGGL